jgi:hypothetical protein
VKPLLRINILFIFLTVAFLGSPRTSEAQINDGHGYYDVTYVTSSSTGWTSTGSSGSLSGAYLTGLQPWLSIGGTVATGGLPIDVYGYWGPPGSASCSGAIVAHLRWNTGGNAANKPPAAILVYESASASYGYELGLSGNGDCDCGLPNSVRYDAPGGGYSYGDRWTTVLNPGQELDLPVSCSPYAAAASVFAGGCEVSYYAFIRNVYLDLTGVLPGSSSNRILVGQNLHAVAGLQDWDPNSPITYSWSVKGGQPFAGWVEAADFSSGEYTPWTPPANTSTSTDVYFSQPIGTRDPATIQVTINTSNPTLSITVPVKVQIDAPTVYREAHDSIGTMQFMRIDRTVSPATITQTAGTNLTPNYFCPFGAARFDDGSLWGIFLTSWVDTPSDYLAEGSGVWAPVQMVTFLLHHGTDVNNLVQENVSSPAPMFFAYNKRSLDGGDPNEVVADAMLFHDKARDPSPGVGLRWHTYSDMPGGFSPKDPSGNFYPYWQLRCYADTYDEYTPPNNGLGHAVKVPVCWTVWSCGGDIAFDGTTWMIVAGTAFSPPPNPADLHLDRGTGIPIFAPTSGEDTFTDHHFGWHRMHSG